MLHPSVHGHVLAVHYDFLFEIIDLFLFRLGLLFDHVVAADEHSFEIGGVRKSLAVLHFRLEVNLSMVCRIELMVLELSLGVSFLLDERNHEVVHGGLVRLLGMLVPVGLLSVDIKSRLCLPSLLVLLLRLDCNLVLVD